MSEPLVFESRLPPLEQLARMCNPIPEPFFTRGQFTPIVTGLMARVSGWDVLRLMFKPSKMIRYGSIMALLRELPEYRLATEGPEYKNARKLATAAAAQAPLYYKGGGGMASAENDMRVLRWSITGDLAPLRELLVITLRAGPAEKEALRLNIAGQPPSDLARTSDPVVFSALWVVGNLRKKCERFRRDMACLAGEMYVFGVR